MARHGDDVDDAAGLLVALQALDQLLRQDEGCADVHGEQPVPQLDAGVVDGAAVGEAGGVDQAVDAPEALLGRFHDVAALVDIAQFGRHEHGAGPQAGEVGRDTFAAGFVAAGDADAAGIGRRGGAGDAFAHPLRAAGDDDDFAVEA